MKIYGVNSWTPEHVGQIDISSDQFAREGSEPPMRSHEVRVWIHPDGDLQFSPGDTVCNIINRDI